MARYVWVGVIVALIGVSIIAPLTYALDPKSSNFQFDETSIGTGGLYGASSTNYQANSSTGDIAIGNSGSGNFQVDSGTKTQRDPTLSFSVNSGAIQFGQLTPTQTLTGTSTFSVSNYTSYGYVVQVAGPTPSTGIYSIDNMDVAATPQTGIEQFGINLVANTAPVSFGSNPDNGQFGYGSVMPDYATANKFRYVDGEIIAQSPKSSGVTNYTISYIINVSPLTAGGQYNSNQVLIVTGTY